MRYILLEDDEFDFVSLVRAVSPEVRERLLALARELVAPELNPALEPPPAGADKNESC
jgi:hypothetical protein